MKKEQRKDITIHVNVAIIMFTILLVFLILIISFWVNPIGNDREWTVRTIDIHCEIQGEDDLMRFTTIAGSIDWEEYLILVDFRSENRTEMRSTEITNAGESIEFNCSDWDPVSGKEYDIMVIHIEDNRVEWEKNIMANSG